MSEITNEICCDKEENELLCIAFMKSYSLGREFKSSECKWSIFDDQIIVKMDSGRCYHFPMTSILFYYIESLKEEENE